MILILPNKSFDIYYCDVKQNIDLYCKNEASEHRSKVLMEIIFL